MRTYSMKAIRALAILIVATLAVSAVPMMADDSAVENVSAAADEGYVRVGWLSTIVNWNPLGIEMVEDYVAMYLMYSTLYMYDQDWGMLVPSLATSIDYDVHANGSMTTTITITDSAYFRNAANLNDLTHQLTAYDVVFSLWLMKNTTGMTFDWYLQDYSDFKVINKFSFSLWCYYEKAILLNDICDVPILPKYVWQNVSNPAANIDPTKQTAQMTVSGAFVFESMLKDAWYKFKKAPNYHGATDYPGYMDVDDGLNGIIYTVYSDVPGMCLEMNKGTEDTIVLTGDIKSFIQTLGKSASVEVYKAAVQENGICDIAVNAIPTNFRQGSYCTGNEVLLDPLVREAIMMTLNKGYINNTLLGGYALEGDSVVDPGFWHKTIENQLPYDPAEAKKLLEDNHWEDLDGNGYLEATAEVWGVQEGFFDEGTELAGIRCQAPDTDATYGYTALAWKGWAEQAGIGFDSSVESEITMINQAWYQADYDIWVWHWGWGPEPIGGALSVWMTSEIIKGGDNCQEPMGEWWAGFWNYTDCPYINASMIEEYNMDADDFRGFSSFDQNISIAMRTMDINDRKAILDDLQQEVYESYTENPPFYDLGLYGYTDYRWDNWGDWEAHNGLNVASDLLWIWFQLEPVVNRAPKFNVPLEDAYTAYVGMEESFVLAVSDFEGDSISGIYSYGDGATDPFELTGDTTKVTYVNRSHEYTTPGNKTLSVAIWDDFDPTRILYRNATVEVQGEYDAPPEFRSAITYDPDPPVYIGTPVEFSVSANDSDGGTQGTWLNFTWDWGDFTYTVDTRTSVQDDVIYTSTRTHTYNVPGDYDVTVYIYDAGSQDEHNVSLSLSTPYEVVANMPPENPTVQPIYGRPGNEVTCIATTSDHDIEEIVVTWEWDDGTYTVETFNPTTPDQTLTSEVLHTWDAVGLYDVTVYADDGEPGHNVSTTIVANITEDANLPPGSFQMVTTPSPVYVGVETTFNVSAIDQDGDALVITIDFGDDSMSTDTTAGGVTTRQYAEFLHTYEDDGVYDVIIYANDSTANSTSSTYKLTVSQAPSNSPPEMQLQSSFSARYNISRSFQPMLVEDEDDDELVVWFDWGDGTPMTQGDEDAGYAATHTYKQVTTFTMTVYVDDQTGLDGHNVSMTSVITVSEANYKPSVERITLEPDQDEYTAGETITFIVTVSDLEGDQVVVVIEFGDGETDEKTVSLEPMIDAEVEFTHTYDSADEYTVNATADDGMDHSNPTLVKETVDVTVVSKGIDMMLVAGVLGIVIALIAILALLMMRKKKKTPQSLGGMEGMAPAEPEPPPQQ